MNEHKQDTLQHAGADANPGAVAGIAAQGGSPVPPEPAADSLPPQTAADEIARWADSPVPPPDGAAGGDCPPPEDGQSPLAPDDWAQAAVHPLPPKKREKKGFGFGALLLAALLGAVLCFVITYTVLARQVSAISAGYQRANKYLEILSVVDNYFIGERPDETVLGDDVAAGVVAALGDRWSYYVSAEDYQAYQNTINNNYVGIGISISARTDDEGNLTGYTVSNVTEGGPADKAGILADDVLLAVDGTDVADITLSETKALVQGESGTQVILTMERDGTASDVTVTRQTVEVIPASGQMLTDTVGMVTIVNFESKCAETAKACIAELQKQGATSIVFDVRNNPGGLKTELTALLDYLLPEGIIFHSVNYAGKEELVESDAAHLDMPMAVLVNGDSYSAAEYFAAALQEYGVAQVVGEKTCGKGYYQTGIQLSDGSCMNLSIGKYFTPKGLSLIDVGVTPNVEQALSDEEAKALALRKLEPKDDSQVQEALKLLG